MRLLLIRHGETPANIAGQLDTAVPGLPLSPLGRRQAAAVPQGLGEQGLLDIGSLFVSTLLRTQQTAEPLAASRRLTPTVLDGLKEVQAGDLEMKDDRHSQTLYNATCFAWAGGDLDLRMPGGESGHEFFERYDRAVASAVASEGPVAIVSHGAAIRTWVAARCIDLDGGFAGTHQLLNTGLAVLESLPRDDRPAAAGTGRAWRLVAWHTEPVGGAGLVDALADDPTGRSTA